MSKIHWAKQSYAILLLCAAAAISLRAQTFTTLFNFNGTNGDGPRASLIQGADGNLYGTTVLGGAYGSGTVFKITPSGTLITIYSFCAHSGCADGAEPWGGLVQGDNGDLYGTTALGGIPTGRCSSGCGTVFKLTTNGTLTTLYAFCSQSDCTDGSSPEAGLVEGVDRNFYGTTVSGDYPNGTVFKITPGGTLTTLYTFRNADGDFPEAALIQASDGNFYGTTLYGGDYDQGVVFKITPSGTLTSLYSFCPEKGCADGARPIGGLVQATNGNFYGTTTTGGLACQGYGGCGTVFEITPGGTFTTLYDFCAQTDCPDGQWPAGTLVLGTDGNLYGTAGLGGANYLGTVFSLTLSGTLTTLQSLDSADGAYPDAGLLQATNGTFYGANSLDGDGGDGTVFSLSVGLGPFVDTLPAFGMAGTPVRILGTDLTGATSVTFNGTPAKFTVNATGTAISTTVPKGATSGTVKVVTPGGTLSSSVPFRVE